MKKPMKKTIPYPEYWKWILGYEGLYKVSTRGRVKSIARKIRRSNGSDLPIKEKILSPTFGNNGQYPLVGLWKENKCKWYYIHRLVLETFVEPCPEGMECRHYPDGNPRNCYLENLSWGTPIQNMSDKKEHGTGFNMGITGSHYTKNLTKKDVRRIKKSKKKIRILAIIFRVHPSTILAIQEGKAWRYQG
jgi:hypothetical protein